MKNLFCIWILLFLSCSESETTEKKLPRVFSEIKNKSIDPFELKEIVQKLDSVVVESPAYWLSIVNDTTYNNYHRAICALMLFKRHLQPGVHLNDLEPVFISIATVHAIELSIRRTVIRGGNWKDMAYYLRGPHPGFSDPELRAFKENIRVKNGKVFYIDLLSGSWEENKNYPCSLVGVYIGVTGEIQENEIEAFIHKQQRIKTKNTVVIDLLFEGLEDCDAL